MDKASDYELRDSRFESWQGRNILSHTKLDFIPNIYCHECLLRSPRALVKAATDKASDYESTGFHVRVLGKVVVYCLSKHY